ncbi:aryl-alcohol dehydrogenase-like predicted oxidoreductase [Microbacteriaceae bacterium SG_E_30_P1]|uniref:Aryl-alcohol dehydrogenase-like predicted oxidoreductase n=1 Tax=Antiquaquibacter oligotrophicus TaxID=2880260 RepID=A0ABT6KL94_9MICO|nr:aldo/keto reductase [Antiquaquibacter oligotrophicus]MDH6180218.1 aryl-alcohol dehydrogenase-like predicted oxidoreductase [Antiquaquibacter oligotrophicus]UDF14035.1 aldo/keto reductase [Antiquaquibacter oligotrophicus]
MDIRSTRRLGRDVSAIGLGTWQLGADWGDVSEADARAILDASAEAGVTIFDTADVYGDGRSEEIIGGFLADRPDLNIFVATKMGRREAQVPENYSLANFRQWTDRSRRNLRQDTLDLVQLHCPPTPVYVEDATYDALDTLVDEGVIARYGVSVETVEQALLAIERPNVASVQIILNAFRLKPLDIVLPAAIEAGVAIIARVPLASGLLSGKYTKDTVFAANDHRTFNRQGDAFDVGETFSGVDFETGVAAAQEFSSFAEAEGLSAPVAALAWLAQLPGVTTVIPGARSVDQARSNASAGAVPRLSSDFSAKVRDLYDRSFREAIHHRW